MKYNELDQLKAIAVEAGLAIMQIYKTDFSVEKKADNSPLTLADRAANEIIIAGLRRSYPGMAILSEESRDDLSRLQSDYCFLVDPLDGTKEFIKRNGQFTVNIALAYRQKPIMGVIYVPVSRQLYYAGHGIGAWKEDAGSKEAEQLTVSAKTDQLVVVGSRSHASEQEARLIKAHSKQIAATLTAGSSLKGCMVAEGKADVYYRFGLTCEWDTAAMQCLVEEAGGIFRQMDGSEMLYNRPDTLNEKGFYIVNRPENIWV